MGSNNFSASAAKIGIIFMTVFGLLVAFGVGQAIGSSDYTMMVLTVGGIFGIFFFLFLGSKYWIIIPFSLMAKIPALPIGGRAIEFPELAIVACAVIYLARIALKLDKFQLFRRSHIPILLFMGWVGLIFFLNPTGFAMLGSGVIGARFYIKIALAFVSFIILTSQKPTDSDLKWIFILIIAGSFLTTGVDLLENLVLGHTIFGESLMQNVDDFYSWHQTLCGPAITIAFVLFSRYRPSDIFGLRRPRVFICYLLVIILALFSGKRMGLASVLISPLVGAVVYREYRYLFFAVMAFFVGATVIITAQGIFSLPLTVQRALSWLPADWDSELRQYAGGSDVFREELRRLAMIQIRRNPILGAGYAIDFNLVASSVEMESHASLYTEQVYQYAAGKSWHNRWLGYSADFGIPMAVILAIIYLAVLWISFRLARDLPHPQLGQVFAVFTLISTVVAVMTSHTSGHSALDAYNTWWMYGLLFAITADLPRPERKTLERKGGSFRSLGKVPTPITLK